MHVTPAAAAHRPDPDPAPLRRLPAAWSGGLGCWLYLPERLDPDLPPLVAVHGIGRAARDQARQFGPVAEAQGRLVIAPLFDVRRWSGFQRITAHGWRADLALLRLLEVVSFQTGTSTRRFDLFGYSAGAQFAHRFAMLHPHRVEHLCVCSAGWYTWPVAAGGEFPQDLSASSRRPLGGVVAGNLGRFLQIPLQVAVGEQDQVVDALTRSTPELDAQQGSHRLERAERWVQALGQQAVARGIRPRAQLTVLPGAGHDFHQCMASGRLADLAMPAPREAAQPLASAA